MTYAQMTMPQKREYAKANTSVKAMRAMITTMLSDEFDFRLMLSIKPREVYYFLTGKEIGTAYLESISNMPEGVDKQAVQLAKVWEDMAKGMRKLAQLHDTDKGIVQKFKDFLHIA